MNILQAIVYGIVQGIGEFLPISSTAHLILVPWIFGWKDPGVPFDVALHLGTAFAVFLFFWKDWVILIRAGWGTIIPSKIKEPMSTNGRLFWFIVIATIPGAIFGVLLDKYMEKFRDPALIAVMLIIMGAVLYIADVKGKKVIKIENIKIKESLLIGLSQVFAVIPGVSRSGITMTTGRLLGLERESIAKFTFLLSAPIILGDALYHASKIGSVPIDKGSFIVAVLTAAIAGTLSIKFLLTYLKTKGFGIFAIYRFILGGVILAIYFLR